MAKGFTKGLLTAKFLFCAGLVVGGAGLGGEVYTSHQSGSVLAEDYGRAAQCEQKLAHNAVCTDAEQTSVAKKKANEEIRTYSHGAVTVGGAMMVWSLL